MRNGPCTTCQGWCPTGCCYTLDNWGIIEILTPEQLKESRIHGAAPELYKATLANSAYMKWIMGHYNTVDREKMNETLVRLGWDRKQEYFYSFITRLTEDALKKVDMK